jgi:hypothetical protein
MIFRYGRCAHQLRTADQNRTDMHGDMVAQVNARKTLRKRVFLKF